MLQIWRVLTRVGQENMYTLFSWCPFSDDKLSHSFLEASLHRFYHQMKTSERKGTEGSDTLQMHLSDIYSTFVFVVFLGLSWVYRKLNNNEAIK